MSKHEYCINCVDGFVARLIRVFLKLRFARQDKNKLFVYWPINEHCIGHFLDVFYPVEDIVFTDKKIFGYTPKVNWDESYKNTYSKDLKLLPHIREKISYFQDKLKYNYIAAHVRRTDIFRLPYACPVTRNELFFQWIDRRISKHDLYLATDNNETQAIFLNRYNNKIFVNNIINPNNQRRQTNLEHTAIDLFMCIYSKDFMGTNLSCWNRFINEFRRSLRLQIKQL